MTNNNDYYEAIAEQIMFGDGLPEKRIDNIATYKPGKTYRDLVVAVKEAGPAGARGAESLIAAIEKAVCSVLEVKTNEALPKFRKLLSGKL